MTTPNEELISMLRAKGCPDWVTARWLMESAADLLQSQAERIAELEEVREAIESANARRVLYVPDCIDVIEALKGK